MANPSPTTRTVTRHDIPEWWRDNKYILAGYRPLEADYWHIIKSLTFLLNETYNVYTYLIGAYIDVTRTDFIIFKVFFYSAESCLILSAVYHLIGSHAHEIYYIFNCELFLQKIHWTIVVFCGSATAALISIPKFRTLRWFKVRVGAYVALGASAFIPLLHGIQVYGLKYMLEYSGMKWYLVELLLYGGGCALYAFSSHQIFHISILCAIYVHTIALTQAFTACHTLDICHIQSVHQARGTKL
ncbi:mPR-like GPCR protein [Fusarium sp. MPI-SDFR-AT-0072]|nr:mPR-like GPCR protein [Fusarium sp. MPI-SDFR-AT-0072]